MRRLTNYEKEVLRKVRRELNFSEKILSVLFKKYSFKILQIGVRSKLFDK